MQCGEITSLGCFIIEPCDIDAFLWNVYHTSMFLYLIAVFGSCSGQLFKDGEVAALFDGRGRHRLW